MKDNLILLEKELAFIKNEQKYIESKLNTIAIIVSTINSLIFLGVTVYFPNDLSWYIFAFGVIFIIPMLVCLIGILPAIKRNKKPNEENLDETRFNIFSKSKERLSYLNADLFYIYQIDLSIKIVKRKNMFSILSVMFEFLCLILFVVLFIVINTL